MGEYRLCRDYVLALDEEMREAQKPKDETDPETWGDAELANAPWETESVTKLG